MDDQTPPLSSWRDGVRRTPITWKVAVAVGVFGWFLVVGSSTTVSRDGVVRCSGTDLGPLVVAVVVAVLGLAGWRRTRTGHPATRLPTRAAWLGAGVLATLVTVHLLRTWIDPAGGMC